MGVNLGPWYTESLSCLEPLLSGAGDWPGYIFSASIIQYFNYPQATSSTECKIGHSIAINCTALCGGTTHMTRECNACKSVNENPLVASPNKKTRGTSESQSRYLR